MKKCGIIHIGDVSNMRLVSYYNILREMKKRPGMFLRYKDIYYLETYEHGYFIGKGYTIINFTNEEIRENVANYFFNELDIDYSLLFLSKICDNNKINDIYRMSLNHFSFVERLVDKEKQFDTIMDMSITLYELILPLIDLKIENSINGIGNPDAETFIIDGKFVNNVNQLFEYIESTKDKKHFLDYPNNIKKEYYNIFEVFSHICFYNSHKQNGVNLIIENEEEFLKENEQEKKVFYTLVNTYKNIIDNKTLFIHPKYYSVFAEKMIEINLVIKS